MLVFTFREREQQNAYISRPLPLAYNMKKKTLKKEKRQCQKLISKLALKPSEYLDYRGLGLTFHELQNHRHLTHLSSVV